MSPNASPESQSPILSEESSRFDFSSDEDKGSSPTTHSPGSVLRARKASHAGQILNKVLEEAENVEHAMLHMLHNAWNVCHFSHLPKWLQDNDYLHFGHRPPLASFKACFYSIFRLHTETLNIWTHGVGCLLFILISVYLFVWSSYSTISTIDKIMLGIFLFTAILCLGFSACYHTLSCHSHQVCILFCKLDYCGISLLIAGSIVPCLYYGFYCSFYPKILYTCLTLVLCMASLIVSFFDKFSEAHYRPVRAGVFTSFALSSVIPSVHWYITHGGLSQLSSAFQSAVYFIILMASLYITGVLFYALRIPERFYPGKFDLYFHSHTLFHIFVFAAAITHLCGLTTMADVRLYSEHQSQCELSA